MMEALSFSMSYANENMMKSYICSLVLDFASMTSSGSKYSYEFSPKAKIFLPSSIKEVI